MVDHDKKITFDCDNFYVGNPLSIFTIWWAYNSRDVKNFIWLICFFKQTTTQKEVTAGSVLSTIE